MLVAMIVAPATSTPPVVIEDIVVEIFHVVPNFLAAVPTVFPKIFAVLLPILAVVFTPIPPIFATILDIVPTIFAVFPPIVPGLLTTILAILPGIVAIIDPVLPLVISVLGTLLPVTTILRAGQFTISRSDPAISTVPGQVRGPIPDLATTSQRSTGQGSSSRHSSGNAEEIPYTIFGRAFVGALLPGSRADPVPRRGQS